MEKFAPWVRKVHFVTCDQKPRWLNASHPKLQLVNHTDYIPEKFLPVFNSSLIEIYLHKIPDLADQFVYFNDDFFIINHLPKSGFPGRAAQRHCRLPLHSGMGLWAKCLKNNIRVINERFDKREVLKQGLTSGFTPRTGKNRGSPAC